MKKLLLWLCLVVPFLSTAQQTWLHIEAQFDVYGPEESRLVITSQNDTLVNHTPTVPNELFTTIVFTDPGDLTVTLLDDWGDGWEDGNETFL